jgi:hypothetical protein
LEKEVNIDISRAPDYGKALSAARKMLALFAREPKISNDSNGLKLVSEMKFERTSMSIFKKSYLEKFRR